MAEKKTLRYSPEFRERAVRLLDEHHSDYPSLSAAWRDVGVQPGPTTAETALGACGPLTASGQ